MSIDIREAKQLNQKKKSDLLDEILKDGVRVYEQSEK